VAILRPVMLWLAGSTRAEGLVRRLPITRPLIRRFVAGDTLEAALVAVRDFNARGLHVALDMLGESVRDETAAVAACDTYVALLERIQSEGVDANISIKPTMLGLDISDELARCHLQRIVTRAAELGNFVRLEMEGSAYTQRTLDLFREVYAQQPGAVGIVLQSYLYRTDRDLEEITALGARVRIVKGAYKEPETVAYQHKSDVNAAYRRHVKLLLAEGHYPAIATHDESMIRGAKTFAARHGIGPERFEFQMLYGVRRDLQLAIAAEGYNMRAYVPYGESWYPYFMRRLAERPANLFFLLRQLVDRQGGTS
jgi:proline dehydrogenase